VNGDGIVCAKPLSPQQQEKFCSQIPEGRQQPVILVFSDNYRGRGYWVAKGGPAPSGQSDDGPNTACTAAVRPEIPSRS
jgi:hypothetical protein